MSESLLAKLENALTDTTGVYVSPGIDPDSYYDALASDIRAHTCLPFMLSAKVMSPGFPDAVLGSFISGQCVAHKAAYWLVYQSEQDRFCCFWGANQSSLGAHGVFGSPLYCWSA